VGGAGREIECVPHECCTIAAEKAGKSAVGPLCERLSEHFIALLEALLRHDEAMTTAEFAPDGMR
jgi:hypothetical protein